MSTSAAWQGFLVIIRFQNGVNVLLSKWDFRCPIANPAHYRYTHPEHFICRWRSLVMSPVIFKYGDFQHHIGFYVGHLMVCRVKLEYWKSHLELEALAHECLVIKGIRP